MKKIDKTKILSTRYREWLSELNRKDKKHPKNSKYYKDVVLNLLHCQEGVCAYTEMDICNPELLDKANWESGRYKPKAPEHLGSLDHFDPILKEDKFWEWGNLFVVDSKINTKKSNKAVDNILKPDTEGYDPFKLLDYDEKTHRFIVNTEITNPGEKARISRMIDVLQLNHGTVCYKRRIFFREVAVSHEIDREPTINRFFTAYQMVMN